MDKPTKEEVEKARLRNKHSVPQAAKLINSSVSAWYRWESGDRTMPAAKWQLYLLLAKK